ncbi:hypothetical protein FOZ61_002991 [Perkinsus olseni]|uniref:Uncharacterized protein n=1 Tax=Perkinsus olseni TaxID=32597 RepID=A0A7J6MDZ9_PEROL|nr:hypothetical protein FOZ61_002991 [Perkinsus olseni]
MDRFMKFMLKNDTSEDFAAVLVTPVPSPSYYFSICLCNSTGNCSSCHSTTSAFKAYTGINGTTDLLPALKEMTLVEAQWTSFHCHNVYPVEGIPGASEGDLVTAKAACLNVTRQVLTQFNIEQMQYYYPPEVPQDGLDAMAARLLDANCRSSGCFQYVLPYTHNMLKDPTDCLSSLGGKCTSFDHRRRGFSIEHGFLFKRGVPSCMSVGTTGTMSMLRGAMGTPPIPEDEQLVVDIDNMGNVHAPSGSGQRPSQQTRFSAVLDTSVSEYPSPSTSPASSISHSLVSAATLADMQSSSHRHFHQTLLQFPRSATPPKPSAPQEVTTAQARIFLCAVINEAVQTERLPAREAMVAMSGVLGEDPAVTDRMYTFVGAGKNLEEQLRMLQLWIEFQSSPLAGAVSSASKKSDHSGSLVSPGDASTVASPNFQESPYGAYYGPGPYGAPPYPPPPPGHYPPNQMGVPPPPPPHAFAYNPYGPPTSRGSPPLQNGHAHQGVQPYGGGCTAPGRRC